MTIIKPLPGTIQLFLFTYFALFINSSVINLMCDNYTIGQIKLLKLQLTIRVYTYYIFDNSTLKIYTQEQSQL